MRASIILILMVWASPCIMGARINNDMLIWENLSELESNGWEGVQNATGYDKPSDFKSSLASLDASSYLGVWVEVLEASSDLGVYSFSHIFKGLATDFCDVTDAGITVMYHTDLASATFAPCAREYCYFTSDEGTTWSFATFPIDVNKLEQIRIEGVIHSPEGGYFMIDTIIIQHNGRRCQPSSTTSSTPVTTTEDPTTPEPTTTTPEPTTATQEPTEEPTTVTSTTTTELTSSSTTPPLPGVVTIDVRDDIPDNGHWHFDCAGGYALAPSDFYCGIGGSVSFPPEDLNGEIGFWTHCKTRCLITYYVQPEDTLFSARLYQRGSQSFVSYNGIIWETIRGDGWTLFEKSLLEGDIQTISLSLDYIAPTYYSLVDKFYISK